MSEPLTAEERSILKQFGHPPDADFPDARLAHRVLEIPNTGWGWWYVASAVTLAAAYLEAAAELSRLRGVNAALVEALEALIQLDEDSLFGLRDALSMYDDRVAVASDKLTACLARARAALARARAEG